ncbi:hypothetical protein AC578_8879 [Pseudocercospora eumusae]|uniref:Uncharacterized protein n=1 Tax=Pseudocercospora eumusae TaxID=321146 RepID=A0A139HBM6_9PEZI|nr:hypothetical protein AC578_8879 [Pseudocercospora eumusae]
MVVDINHLPKNQSTSLNMKSFSLSFVLMALMSPFVLGWDCGLTNGGDGVCRPNEAQVAAGGVSQLCAQSSPCKAQGNPCTPNANKGGRATCS